MGSLLKQFQDDPEYVVTKITIPTSRMEKGYQVLALLIIVITIVACLYSTEIDEFINKKCSQEEVVEVT